MVVLGEDLAETGQHVEICLLGGGKLSVVGDEEDKGECRRTFGRFRRGESELNFASRWTPTLWCIGIVICICNYRDA